MWSPARIAIAALVLAAFAAAGYAELVLDIRAPRVLLNEAAVINTQSRLASGSEALDAEMKTKYGPKAITYFQPKPTQWVVKVDDQVVYRAPATLRVSGAFGFLAIGAPGKIASLFPFRLDLQDKQPSHRYSMEELRQWFDHDDRIVRYLDFNDRAEAEGPCVELGSSDFGWAGKLLDLRTGRFCLIGSTGGRQASALIGTVLADGDPWMRPFSGRICRGVTALALRKIAAARPRPPDYAACLLVDRPTRQGTAALRFQDYGVGADGTLALILLPKSTGAAADALPPLQ
jgi:hypothetical protein